MKTSQLVSFVVTNYNGVKLLRQNLPAVMGDMQNGDELVVVDDCSTDYSIKWLVDWSKAKQVEDGVTKSGEDTREWVGTVRHKQNKLAVTILQLKQNVRFARAANAGVKVAKNELIFLLNNDVAPHEGCSQILRNMFHQPKLFAVGCLELNPQNPDDRAGKNQLRFYRGMFWHSKAKDFNPGTTAWASGGSGMFSKEKWIKLGGFDKRFYPAYWEDVDLSFRAKIAGWQVMFEPTAVVDHNHETTNQAVFGNEKIITMSWQSANKFTQIHAHGWKKLAYYFWQPYWKVKFTRWRK